MRIRGVAPVLALALACGCVTPDPKPEPAPPTPGKPVPAPASPAPSNGAGSAAPRAPDGAEVARAHAAGWEKGRTALVVDLILRSKSFDRGFEAALLFLPDMREGVTSALLEQAGSLDGRIRERSLEALGSMARLRLVPDSLRKRAVEVVGARVRTETATAAWAASINALGALAGVDAGREIVDALGRAVDEDQGAVVRACSDVLGDLEYRAAEAALVSASERVRDRYAARTLIRALGRVGGARATERLTRALAAADAGEREAAASALGESGGAAAATALRAAILRPDESPTVRRSAIAALERMGGPDATRALEGALEDLKTRRDDPWVAISRDLSETLERIKRK